MRFSISFVDSGAGKARRGSEARSLSWKLDAGLLPLHERAAAPTAWLLGREKGCLRGGDGFGIWRCGDEGRGSEVVAREVRVSIGRVPYPTEAGSAVEREGTRDTTSPRLSHVFSHFNTDKSRAEKRGQTASK